MISTRRSLLKAGLAGLLVPQASLAFAGDRQNWWFEAWRCGFEAAVPARMRAANVIGAAVAISSKDGAMRYASAFGFADLNQQRRLTANTPMHLASISKMVTAAALVQLFERRGLDLHGDINRFIDFPVRNPHHPDVPITPHHLITHTSSIWDDGYKDFSTDGDPTQSLPDFLRDYLVEGGRHYSPKTSFHSTRPGELWDYCNVAVALAGHVIESISGQSFPSYIKANIFGPLGITNAHWYLREFPPGVLAKPYEFRNGRFVELPQEGYPDVPAGMLRCSVSDLAKILRAIIAGGTGPRAILSPRAAAAMRRPQVDAALVPYQGLGWVSEEINGRPFVGHSGGDSGASNMMVLTRDQRHAVMILMNIEGTDKTERFRASMIEDLLFGARLAGWGSLGG